MKPVAVNADTNCLGSACHCESTPQGGEGTLGKGEAYFYLITSETRIQRE